MTVVLDKNAGPIFQRLANIALGRKIRIGGPPQDTYIHPSETSQMKALEILARKLKPDLAAQQISGADGDPLFPKDVKPGDLAKAVHEILQADERPADDPPPIDESLFSDDPPPEPATPQNTYEAFDNGAEMRLVDVSGSGSMKWEIRDGRGERMGYRVDENQARLFASNLPSYEIEGEAS